MCRRMEMEGNGEKRERVVQLLDAFVSGQAGRGLTNDLTNEAILSRANN